MTMAIFSGLQDHDLNRKAVEIIYNALSDGIKTSDFAIPDTKRADSISGQNTAFDILWKKTRICVRAARQLRSARFPRWMYNVAGVNKGKVDLYVLITVRDEAVYKIFVLPPSISPTTTITITEKEGFLRYAMLETPLERLEEKLFEVQAKLPELESLYREAKE